MKNREKEKTTKPFYKTAKRLLGLKIKTKEDTIKFLVGVNNLAKEILENKQFVEDFSSNKYNDNIILKNAFTDLLGYGFAVSKKKKIFDLDEVKEIRLVSFYKKNPKTKIKILSAIHVSSKMFSFLDKFTKQEQDEIKSFIEETVKGEVLKQITNFTQTSLDTEVEYGPLKYKDYSIYHNGSRIKTTFQSVKICRAFIETLKQGDKFISYDKIRGIVSPGKFISNKNIQREVYKFAKPLEKEKCKIKIESLKGEGYNLII